MPGEECCISGPVPLCHLNHCRFLVPQAFLYKAQTAAGFSTLLPGNWINTMPVDVFTVIRQHPEGPALTGRWPPVPFCSSLFGGGISQYGQCMAHCVQSCIPLWDSLPFSNVFQKMAQGQIHSCDYSKPPLTELARYWLCCNFQN